MWRVAVYWTDVGGFFLSVRVEYIYIYLYMWARYWWIFGYGYCFAMDWGGSVAKRTRLFERQPGSTRVKNTFNRKIFFLSTSFRLVKKKFPSNWHGWHIKREWTDRWTPEYNRTRNLWALLAAYYMNECYWLGHKEL